MIFDDYLKKIQNAMIEVSRKISKSFLARYIIYALNDAGFTR